jgi:hypothetical protein
MQKGAIFPLFYLPPIHYYSKLVENKSHIIIENAEHFEKQSYRNRASIHSPNGRLDLIVPVIKGSKNHTRVKDVKISYDFNWQRIHWLSLQTSYRSSAYFEYYEDDLMPFYEKRWNYLFDYNEELFNITIRLLKLNLVYDYTNVFEIEHPQDLDFRSTIHPKVSNENDVTNYFQVFEERNGFLPNLSIVDLLFNQGPQSSKYL